MSNRTNPVLTKFPVPKFNVFLTMRFLDSDSNSRTAGALRAEAHRYALNVLRADDQVYCSDLWENVKSYMDACKLGIAVFDQIQTGGFNPNISLEIGYMLAGGSVPLLLKERCLPSLPSDIVGKLYREFDIKNLEVTIKKAMRGWLRDIGIAKTPTERLVVFVSTGGRDRCAMAKVIAQELFKKNTPPFPLRFESMAAFHGNGVMASDQSRRVIEESYKKDLLASHRVMRRCDGIIQDADLILVMEKEFLGFFPCEKTHLITEFFGRSGDITNPKPGNLSDYNKCLKRLRPLIETNYRKILRALENRDREAVDDEQSHH